MAVREPTTARAQCLAVACAAAVVAQPHGGIARQWPFGYFANMPNHSLPRDVPPLWFLLGLGSCFLAHFALPMVMVVPQDIRPLGYLPMMLAGAIAGAALWRFRRANTGVRPFSPVTMLVSGGPFRWTRNPMYLALVLVLVGVAIRLGSLTPFAAGPWLWWVLDRRFVRREEEFLLQRLGEPYREFCRRVPRWLGRPNPT